MSEELMRAAADVASVIRLDHVGYATPDLATTSREFEALGWQPCGKPVEDAGRNVRILFLKDAVGQRVELVEPLDRDKPSPVNGTLASHRNVPHPYHLCLEVPDLETEIKKLSGEGWVVTSLPAPAPAIGCRRVCFLLSRSAGLVELLES